ncbi:PilZ domain-containing protein [Caminibacter sp.]
MESFKNRFFQNNFLSFLAKYEKFFKSQEIKFAVNFLEILKKKNPYFKITTKHKDFIKELYEHFFINKNYENFAVKNSDILKELKEANIDIEDILNKLFLLLSNAFIKHVIKEKNSINELKKMVSLLDFYIEYILYHVNEPLAIQTALPKEIKDYYLHNTKLYLFSVYKGVPIANSTTINTLNDEKGYIEVNANYYQMIASKFQKEVYLLEPKSNKTFRAFIKNRYPARKILELYNIEKINRKTPKRNYIRVQPNEEITVAIQKQNEKVETTLYDISLKGCALISDKKIPVEIGDFVKLSFILDPDDFFFFNLEAELKSISKLANNSYRYHFYFEPNPKEEKALERYITKREKEIIKELQVFMRKELLD